MFIYDIYVYILCLFYANFEVNAWIRKKHIFYAKYLLLYVYLPHLLSNKTDHHDITDILLTVALNTPIHLLDFTYRGDLHY